MRGVCVGVLLHIPCWLYFHLGSFSYTSLVCFNFMWGFSLTRPFLFVCFVFNLWSFSSTSPAGFIFKRGVSLTHPVLASLLFWEFLLHIPCWLIFYLILFNFFNWGVGGIFLTHVLLAFSSSFFFSSFLYLLHIPYWLHFYLGSFSDTSRTGFNVISGLSLTHPMPISFLSRAFLLHIPFWLHYYFGSFSYTSRTGFTFCGKFLLHIPCWLLF